MVDRQWLDQAFPHAGPIGYRKITAVCPSFTGKGIGSRLVSEGMRLLQEKTSAVVSVAWKSTKGVHIGSQAREHGWQHLLKVENYWQQDSLEKQYTCASCGHPPCKCSAVVYAKYFK